MKLKLFRFSWEKLFLCSARKIEVIGEEDRLKIMKKFFLILEKIFLLSEDWTGQKIQENIVI